ncbi:tetratricopeptide repeat protein [Vibrio sp. HN007]|uniref:tetratricopeptide repeat protein n=1 Tax=Vibrio iocasae TaxID=3098914 RepID=UPI0035D4C78C
MKSFSEACVLILNRSTTTAENLKKLLILLGFKEHQIYSSYSPEAAVGAYFPVKFDLVVSEHLFPNSLLTSVEVASEMKEKNMVCRNVTFVVFSDKPIPSQGVNSEVDEVIVLQGPDFASLKAATKRIRAAFISRQKISLIGLASDNEPLGELLSKCNEVEIKYPELFYPIQKYRGGFFSAHGMHDVTVNLYRSMISRLDKNTDSSWLYEVLISALINNGQTDEAEKTFQRISSNGNSLPPGLIEAQAQILLSKSDVAGAINTYELLANQITLDVNRLRLLGHMYLFVKKFEKCLESYLQAVQIAEGTRRTKLDNQLLYIRALLYVRSNCRDAQAAYRKKFELEVNKIEKRKYTLEDKVKLSIIELHALVFKGRLPEALRMISDIIPIIGKVDSSTKAHFLSILDDLMLVKEFAYVYQKIDNRDDQASGMEKEINRKLIEQRKKEHQLRCSQSNKIALKAEKEMEQGLLKQACQTCLSGYYLYPYSERIGLNLLDILAKTRPDNMGSKQIATLITSVNKTVLPFLKKDSDKREKAEKAVKLVYEEYA